MEKIKKTIYTLALKGYAPDLTAVTFQLMKKYAQKIEAEFYVIEDRKFPDKYVTYEKFQIWDLMKERGDDWSFFFDADTMIHPDMFDPTVLLHKDQTCAGYSHDFTPLRFRPDYVALRDGRFIGKGSWFILCSDWTRDIWHPIDESDITYEQCVENMFPTNDETVKIKKTKESLIDDYVVSRNIAKYGLKHTVLSEICKERNINIGVEVMLNNQKQVSPFLQHDYNRPLDQKLIWTETVLKMWGVTL
jgi:hypothetical protein